MEEKLLAGDSGHAKGIHLSRKTACHQGVNDKNRSRRVGARKRHARMSNTRKQMLATETESY